GADASPTYTRTSPSAAPVTNRRPWVSRLSHGTSDPDAPDTPGASGGADPEVAPATLASRVAAGAAPTQRRAAAAATTAIAPRRPILRRITRTPYARPVVSATTVVAPATTSSQYLGPIAGMSIARRKPFCQWCATVPSTATDADATTGASSRSSVS